MTKQAVRLFVVVLAYVAAGWLGLQIPYTGSHITLIWLPTGIAVAAIVRWGWAVWPAVYLGAFLVNLVIGSSLMLALAIAVGNTLGPLCTAWWIKRGEFRAELDDQKSITSLIAGSLIGMAIPASCGVASLYFSGLISADSAAAAWLTWWMGDAVGVLLIGPLLLNLNAESIKQLGHDRRELLPWVAFAVPVIWFVFVHDYGLVGYSLPLAFLTLPLLVWAALSFGMTGAGLAGLIFSAVAAWCTASGRGPFQNADVHVSLFLLWSYMATTVVTIMLVTALQSQRQLAGKKLQQSEERFRSLTSLSSDWYWEQDRDLRLTFHSEGFSRSSGIPSARLIGKLRWDEPGRIPLNCTWDEHRAALEARQPFRDFEYFRTGDDGKRYYASISGEPVYDDQGNFTGYRGIGTNITGRKLAEAALREREERLRAIIETEPECVKVVSPDGHLIEMNRAGLVMIEADSFEQVRGGQTLDLVVQEHRAAYGDMLRRVMAGENCALEFEIFGLKGGRHFLNTHAAPLRGPDGQITGLLGITRDVTERKHAEAARLSLEAQLRESQKMQAIGTLAGGIAHDFNNIIGAIRGNTELAYLDAGDNPELLQSLGQIRKAAVRARDLVQQILSFSRRQPTERKPTHLVLIIEESMRLLRAVLPARLSFEVHCAADVPVVQADANQIQQALINLVNNAMQAHPGGPGRIGVRLDTVMLDAALVSSHPALRELHAQHPGRTVRLAVSDTGAGMEASTLARIFEPFFTTKPVGEGTGLGLSVVLGIVQTHEGAIVVESQPGTGSTFTLYLPVAAPQAGANASAQMVPAATSDTTGGWHILYLDDDAMLVSLVDRLLTRRGCRVSGYTDQGEALSALRAHPDAFDVVLTDYNMPGMSGLDVAHEVRLIRPELTVAVTSGFIDETLRLRARAAGVQELISKADGVEALCEALQRLAEKTSAPNGLS